MNKSVLLILFLASFTSSAPATTLINFDDGQPNNSLVGSFYDGLGVTTPNLRFFDSTAVGNVPFNFTDNWGAVVDFGVLSTTVGFINFSDPVDYVQVDVLAQAAFDLNGSEPYSWTMVAFDASNNQVASVSEAFGLDFAGVPNPPNTDPYPLARLSLRVEALGSIAKIEINSDRKIGLDTLSFGPEIVPHLPEPTAFTLFGLGLAALGCMLRKPGSRSRVATV